MGKMWVIEMRLNKPHGDDVYGIYNNMVFVSKEDAVQEGAELIRLYMDSFTTKDKEEFLKTAFYQSSDGEIRVCSLDIMPEIHRVGEGKVGSCND
jgi:hypothetical protein